MAVLKNTNIFLTSMYNERMSILNVSDGSAPPRIINNQATPGV